MQVIKDQNTAYLVSKVESLKGANDKLKEDNKILKELNSGKLLAYDAMKETLERYALQISELTEQLAATKSNATFWEEQYKDLGEKYKALTTYVKERRV